MSFIDTDLTENLKQSIDNQEVLDLMYDDLNFAIEKAKRILKKD